MCYRCFKAAATCICALVPRIDNRTGVTIIQHPRERHHPIGTARFALLGLSRVELVVHGPKDGEAPILASLPPGAALLYPDGSGQRRAPEARPTHLLVLDGTWHHARKLFQANPALAAMPRFALSGDQPSRYRIRSEPADYCLSTIEAIAHALSALEPETEGFDLLIGAFEQMVGQQAVYMRRGQPRKKRRPRLRLAT